VGPTFNPGDIVIQSRNADGHEWEGEHVDDGHRFEVVDSAPGSSGETVYTCRILTRGLPESGELVDIRATALTLEG
jgi:hypothetical protein